MSFLMSIGLTIQVIAAIAIVVLVLLQHGKGADLGAAFGSGASGSVFGAAGSGTFLSRMTWIAVAVFFLSTIAITLGSGAFSHRNQVQRQAAEGGVLGTVSSVPADAAASAAAEADTSTFPSTPSKNAIPQ